MTDESMRGMIEEIRALLRILVMEDGDEEDIEEFVKSLPVKPVSGGVGAVPQLVVVTSPLSGEHFLWLRRPAGDSFVEEIKPVINFGKG